MRAVRKGRTRFVPSVVFSTAVAGVVPAIVVACSSGSGGGPIYTVAAVGYCGFCDAASDANDARGDQATDATDAADANTSDVPFSVADAIAAESGGG